MMKISTLNKPQYRNMGEAARARIMPYTPQRLGAELHSLYQQLLSGAAEDR
ncbi:hypothetical protein [Mixta calida]|uniref:hypothetical protein n=1 Tax=Mixta calida TaxID=665913 RepID=UPI00403AA6C5